MLWGHPDLKELRSFSSNPGWTLRELPGVGSVEIERWTVRFPPAEPSKLPESVLKKTYTTKPLVEPYEKPVFGELAILKSLDKDGWSGVWVDTYHGSELFWRDMPHQSSAVDLSDNPKILDTYRRIVSEHGKRGGFFDVLAWRDSELLFIEYKGAGDRPNSNEASWIAAALRTGIDSSQLLFAEYKL